MNSLFEDNYNCFFRDLVGQLGCWSVALEVLLSRGGKAEICVTTPTSARLRPPDLPPCYRSIRQAYHALYFSKNHLESA